MWLILRKVRKALLVAATSPPLIAGSVAIASDQVEKSPEELISGKDDFTYWLITDEKNQPVRSGIQSPLYQGEKQIRDQNRKITIFSSLVSLFQNDHVLSEHEPGLISEVSPKSLGVFLSDGAVVNLLKYLQDHPDKFLSFFSGMSAVKAELFRGLLFHQELTLHQNDLRTLRRNAWDPLPAPLEIPLPITARGKTPQDGYKPHWWNLHSPWVNDKLLGGWDLLTEMINSIEVEKLNFNFTSKSITFDPLQQTMEIVLRASEAKLEGRMHQIGQFRDLHRYRDAAELKWIKNLIRYWDKNLVLLSGEVKQVVYKEDTSSDVEKEVPLELQVQIKFVPHDEKYWKIELARPLKFIVPALPNEDPKVHLKFIREEWIRENDPTPYSEHDVDTLTLTLSKAAQNKIEETLNAMLIETFSSSFFANDLGIHLPLSDEKDDVELAGALSQVEVESKGLRIGFDPQLKVRKVADCLLDRRNERGDERAKQEAFLKSFAFTSDPKSTVTEDTPTGSSSNANAPWALKSVLREKDKKHIEMQPWAWQGKGKAESRIELDVLPMAQQRLFEGLYLGGQLCLSSDDGWTEDLSEDLQQTLGKLPRMSIRPTAVPRWESAIESGAGGELSLSLELQTYQRSFDFYREKWEPSESQTISLQYPLVVNGAAKNIQLPGIRNLKISQLERDELAEIQEAVDLGMRKALSKFNSVFLEGGKDHLAVTFSQLDRAAKNRLKFEAIHWGSEGLKVAFDPLQFAWFPSKEPSKAEASVRSGTKIAQIEFADDLPTRVRDSEINIRWKQKGGSSSSKFSWILKEPKDLEWGKNWSPAARIFERSFSLQEAGWYSVAVKSISGTGFSEPQVFRFYYSPR